MKNNKGPDYCRVISNHDIESLLYFATKELGSYKLIYKKKCYRKQFILVFISAILAGVLSLLAYRSADPLRSVIAIILSCILIIVSFVLGHRLRGQAKSERMELQSIRMKMLENYYIKKNYNLFQIEQICEMLKIKLSHLEKNSIYILLIAGSFFLSLWNAYVQQVINSNSGVEFPTIVLFLGLRIIILLIIIAAFAPFLRALKELNFNSFSQGYLIENLVYLTTYITHSKQVQKLERETNGKKEKFNKYCKRRSEHGRKRRRRR